MPIINAAWQVVHLPSLVVDELTALPHKYIMPQFAPCSIERLEGKRVRSSVAQIIKWIY